VELDGIFLMENVFAARSGISKIGRLMPIVAEIEQIADR
jgi:hypothetical protein